MTMNLHSAAESGKAPSRAARFALISLSFQTLGIIYSDIGTSPLYTLNGLWPSSGPVPSEEDVIGGISAIIWALTLLPLVKYILISLQFGTTEGEGGTFALYQGLYPPEERFEDDESIATGDDLLKAGEGSRPTISPKLRWPLFVWCIFGTSLTLADGIFTPAVSVTSAVSGIGVAKPSVLDDVAPISIALLVALFLAQSRGTAQLGFLFAPVTCVWLILLASTGIVNITSHPGVFRAFDPSRAIMLFVRTKNYDLLGGVLLAITGCEAMFATLGHFNKRSIQLAFSFFVYPSLVLAYLGQGARLIADRDEILPNIFYRSIPGTTDGPLYWIMFVFGILATFIASQTLITAAFSLIQQLIKMHVFPPLRVVHTSDTVQGQIYIPAVNWILMILTIIVVATFKDTTALSNAYGFSVATVMFSTTVLIAVQMKFVKRWHILVAVAFFIIFGFLDGLFWGAALKKIPHGAWVPLVIGTILVALMSFWSWAKGLEDTFDAVNRRDLHNLIVQELKASKSEYDISKTEPQDGGSVFVEEDNITKELNIDNVLPTSDPALQLARLPTCAVFHRLTSGRGIPHSFAGFIRQLWPALPRVVIFLSLHVLSVPYVDPNDRLTVRKYHAVKGFYGVTYRMGYRETFDTNVDPVIEQICMMEEREDPECVQEIRVAARRTTHIVPHYVVASKSLGSTMRARVLTWARRLLIDDLYRRLATMFPETAGWLGSADEIIHVGVNAVI